MKTKLIKHISIILMLSFIFGGCTDNKSTVGQKKETKDKKKEIKKQQSSTIEFHGKVIDGEVVGAIVYLDLNRDEIVNEDEPYTNTSEDGSYTLTLTKTQSNHQNVINKSAPLIAYGGYDLRTKNRFNATFKAMQTHKNITPITTLVTQIAQNEIEDIEYGDKTRAVLNTNDIENIEAKAREQVASALDIASELIDKNPIEEAMNGNSTLLNISLKIHNSAKLIKESIDTQADISQAYHNISYTIQTTQNTKLNEALVNSASSYFSSEENQTVKNAVEFLVYNIDKKLENKVLSRSLNTLDENAISKKSIELDNMTTEFYTEMKKSDSVFKSISLSNLTKQSNQQPLKNTNNSDSSIIDNWSNKAETYDYAATYVKESILRNIFEMTSSYLTDYQIERCMRRSSAFLYKDILSIQKELDKDSYLKPLSNKLTQIKKTQLSFDKFSYIEPKSKNSFVTVWRVKEFSNKLSITTRRDIFSYSYDIKWGDGKEDKNVRGNITHTYNKSGIYQVEILGEFPQLYFSHNDNKLLKAHGTSKQLLSVRQWGNIKWKSMNSMFYGCSHLTFDATDTPDLSEVEDMSWMFYAARNFNSDISNWNFSNVTDMSNMFGYTNNFNQDLSSWDTSNVTDMSYMFYRARKFNQKINNWNVSHVANMKGMFSYSIKFNQDILSWDTRSVKSMRCMFAGARNFNQYIGDWNTSNVTDMNHMFVRTDNFNQYIGDWNISNVTDMKYMFGWSKNFNQSLENWNFNPKVKLTNMIADTHLSTSNYDIILNKISEIETSKGVEFNAGSNKYCKSREYRNKLINQFGWKIKDGGVVDNSCITLYKPNVNLGNDKNIYFQKDYLLDGSNSSDTDGKIVKYEWKDNGVVIGSKPKLRHTFTRGIHIVELIVTDNDGLSNSDTMTISVYKDKKKPIVEIEATTSIIENQNASFDASKSYDKDGNIVKYSWSEDGVLLSSDKSFTKADFSVGKHTITLRVTDDNGLSSSKSIRLIVKRANNHTPYFISDSSVDVYENQTDAITLNAVDSDGDTVTYSIANYDSSVFDIDKDSGVVTFKIAPNYEAKKSYSFLAIARDGQSQFQKKITINILDVAEYDPLKANIKLVSQAKLGQKIEFDASSSTGNITRFEWKDNNTIISNKAIFSKDDLILGEHLISLKVYDDGGYTSVVNAKITISKDGGKDEVIDKNITKYPKQYDYIVESSFGKSFIDTYRTPDFTYAFSIDHGLLIYKTDNKTKLKLIYEEKEGIAVYKIIGLKDNHILICNSELGLIAYDVSNKSNPRRYTLNIFAKRWEHISKPYDRKRINHMYEFALDGDYLYIRDDMKIHQTLIDTDYRTEDVIHTDRQNTLKIYDLSDLSKPSLVSNYNLMKLIPDIANQPFCHSHTSSIYSCMDDVDMKRNSIKVLGEYLYIIEPKIGLFIIDIKDKTNPILKGSIKKSFKNSDAIFKTQYQRFLPSINDKYIFIEERGWWKEKSGRNKTHLVDEIFIIDISDKSNPTYSTFSRDNDSEYYFFANNKYAYISEKYKNYAINIYDISDIFNINLVSELNLKKKIDRFKLFEDKLIGTPRTDNITSLHSGYYSIDISNIQEPIATEQHLESYDVHNNYVYNSDFSRLHVHNNYVLLYEDIELFIKDDWRKKRTLILNMDNKDKPKVVFSGNLDIWENSEIISEDDYLYSVKDNRLSIYNLFDISNPKKIKNMRIDTSEIRDLIIKDSVLYILGIDKFLVYDVSNKRYPKLIYSNNAEPNYHYANFYLDDDRLYVSTYHKDWDTSHHTLENLYMDVFFIQKGYTKKLKALHLGKYRDQFNDSPYGLANNKFLVKNGYLYCNGGYSHDGDTNYQSKFIIMDIMDLDNPTILSLKNPFPRLYNIRQISIDKDILTVIVSCRGAEETTYYHDYMNDGIKSLRYPYQLYKIDVSDKMKPKYLFTNGKTHHNLIAGLDDILISNYNDNYIYCITGFWRGHDFQLRKYDKFKKK